ncbi:hypothetical protein KHA94_24755 [Bacillus sp. FJAT-49705]|uniref:Uncharacterized protein n=1 Tax=Cytobacillus citreus TaxID=2833586 RepID=A0ABS5NZM7_9BACI|nr:hypothetical protein [Cytobacillus citreus]MBS4193299.1 hypothetical protein [Cytobacillus citreus]
MGKIILASIFSFLFPGLGQLYNKQRMKGIIFIFVGIILIYINIIGFRLPLTLFRFIAAGEALWIANKKVKLGENEGFLKPKKAVIELGIASIIIFSSTFVPYRFFIKPVTNYFTQAFPEKSEEEIKIAEEKMIKYLEDKYQKEFIITDKTYYIPELGKYDFVLSPKDQTFYFGGFYYADSNKFEDFYMNGLWGEEFDKEVEPLVHSLFKNVWEYSTGVWVDDALRKEKINPLDIPNYKQLRELYPEGYDQKFQLYVFENMNEKNKMEKLEKVYELVKWVKTNNIKNIQFEVSFYEEKLLEDQGKKISPGMDNLKYLQYEVVMSSSDFLQVNSVDDLLEYTEKNE